MYTNQKPCVTVITIAAIMAIIFTMFPASVSAKGYGTGDIVTFGTYEQDNISSNGAEKIEWIVLEVQPDRILLLSRYALDSERYHYRKENVNWDTCSVRDWLNDTFYREAFTRADRERILSSETSIYDDYVFLLSDEEAEVYIPRTKDRICKATPYCAGQNVYVNPSTGGSWWLLRTTGDDGSKFAMSVNSDGTIDYDGGHVESDRGTVRPAIWLKIEDKNKIPTVETSASDLGGSPYLSKAIRAKEQSMRVDYLKEEAVNSLTTGKLLDWDNDGTEEFFIQYVQPESWRFPKRVGVYDIENGQVVTITEDMDVDVSLGAAGSGGCVGVTFYMDTPAIYSFSTGGYTSLAPGIEYMTLFCKFTLWDINTLRVLCEATISCDGNDLSYGIDGKECTETDFNNLIDCCTSLEYSSAPPSVHILDTSEYILANDLIDLLSHS